MARASTSRSRAPQGEKLRGKLVDWRDWKQGWGFGTIETTHDGGRVKITGTLIGAKLGAALELTGFHTTGKYGPEFKFTAAEVVVPQDAAGVVGWLASMLPQISARRAEQMVSMFGIEGTWRVLDECDLDELSRVDGITPERAKAIFEAYAENKAERDRMVALKGWGLTDAQIARVVEAWGTQAIERLTENPYQLMEMVTGFGWTRADAVALRMGIAKDNPSRLRAGILHKLDEAKFDGHCYVPGGKLVKTVADAKTCGVDEQSVRNVLEKMIAKGELVRRDAGVFLPFLEQKEQSLAGLFAARVLAQKGKAA